MIGTSRTKRLPGAAAALVLACASLALPWQSHAAESETVRVSFDSDVWVAPGGQVVEHDGLPCFAGFGYVDGVDLATGVVEVDLYATGASSYPGIVFHMADGREYEWIYVRPHRAGQYPDAVQYSPTMNGISSWQLWNGDGYTAPVELPEGEWVTLRLEFSPEQARFYVGDSDEPALHVRECRLDGEGGHIGLRCPPDGSALFSNLRYGSGRSLSFAPVPPADPPPGAMTEWDISPVFRMDAIDLELPPSEQDVGEFEWERVAADPDGLLDIGRYRGRTGGMPDCIFAKTTIDAEEAETLRLEFGYSDAVSVFLNGRLLFTASNAYRQRDPTALGIIGLHDAVYLPLEKGPNELAFTVTESFGGWGLIARDGGAMFTSSGVEDVFETGGLLTPECVLYDQERDVLYVSNFDTYRRAVATQYLSKLGTDGAVEDLEWVSGLSMPTGMALSGSTLYVVERSGLAVVDVASGEVAERHSIRGAAFPNDVAVDGAGVVYVSDSGGDTVFRFENGEFSVFLGSDKVSGPNAVLVREGALIVGNGGDSTLRSYDLSTGVQTTIARFRDGNIDGIALTDDGDYLISHWEGRLYRVSPEGAVTRLLDSTVRGAGVADFGYDRSTDTVFIPTFYTDQVVGYRLKD